MRFPELDTTWLHPVDHERKLYVGTVLEIQYPRIIVATIVGISTIVLLYPLIGVGSYLAAFILSLSFFPLLVTPWDLVLSNKRFVARKRYWFLGRFSRVTSFNLTYLETITTTPRVKVGILLLGYVTIQQALLFLNYSLTGLLELPLEVEALLWLLDPIVGSMVDWINTAAYEVFAPYKTLIFFCGMILLVLGLILFIFGLPHRKELQIKTGRHQFIINAGISSELQNRLFGVARKEKIRDPSKELAMDIPMLEDENIRFKTRLGVVEKRTQILAILGLFLFLNSLPNLVVLLSEFSAKGLGVFALRLVGLMFILFSIRFAKYFYTIVITDHRVLFQQERQGISGLWGRRLFRHTDLPLIMLQGFSVSHFSGIPANGIVSSLILLVTGLFFYYTFNNSSYLVLGLIGALLVLVITYKTTSEISFLTRTGEQIRFGHSLPGILSWLSHKLEERRFYDFLFPNILNEDKILGLFNSCRGIGITPTLEDRRQKSQHKIEYRNFLAPTEEEKAVWRKFGPQAFYRASLLLGVILSLISVPLVFYYFLELHPSLFIPFIILSLCGVSIVSLRKVVTVYRTLVVTEDKEKKRVLYIEETLPRRIARIFGVLPESYIYEIGAESIIGTKYSLKISKRGKTRLINSSTLLVSLFIAILAIKAVAHNVSGVSQLLFILGLVVIVCVPGWVHGLFRMIPRYQIHLQGNFFTLRIPFLPGIKQIDEVLHLE